MKIYEKVAEIKKTLKMRREVSKTACQQGFTMLILTLKWYELLVIISLILDHSKLTFTDEWFAPRWLWEVKHMANKAELVSNVATATGLTKKDATAAVDAVFSSIQASLAKGEKVQLIGFGNFEVRQRAARKGRNPQTGQEIQIPASKVPAFKPGKALKDAVK